MAKLPDAAPIPDEPPLHLKGGYLCIASPEGVNEACFSVPAVRALRGFRPQATIAVLCPESLAPLWKTVTVIDGVVTYPDGASVRAIAKIIQAEKITFESSLVWEEGKVAKALEKCDILQRLGYPLSGLVKYLTTPVEVLLSPGPVIHRVRYYLNLVEKLGADVLVKENFQPAPLPSAPETLRIAIAPCSDLGTSHEWSVERFMEMMKVMQERYRDTEWVVVREGKDTSGKCDLLEKEIKDAGGELLHGPAEWGMEEMLRGLSHCSALVACDGMAAHLAAHVGLPSAVIFGPNEPQWKRPLGKQNQVIREHVACSPCFESKCPVDNRCMEEVSVELVVAELERALAIRHAG